jgi:hypothetical protein
MKNLLIPLTIALVGTFGSALPEDAKLPVDWGAKLQQTLAGTTRVRVRSGGTCHRQLELEKTLVDESDPAAIKELLASLKINPKGSGFHCMCCGNPSLEFYAGEKLVATLGFHHGRSVRWVEGWTGDGLLVPDGAATLVAWLERRGAKGPREELDAASERVNAEQRKLKRALSGLPPELVTAYSAGRFKTELPKYFKENAEQIRVLLRMFGASNNSWSSLEQLEQRVEEWLRSYEKQDVINATEAGLLGRDRQLQRGAARYWQSWRSPIEDWVPKDPAKIYRIVLALKQESRYPSLRLSAVHDIGNWEKVLGADEVRRRAINGLHDPDASVRRTAMLLVGRIQINSLADELIKVLKGETLAVQPLPEVPPAETQDIEKGFEEVAGTCSDAEVAALALGYLKFEPAKAAIQAHVNDAPLYAVALALMGDVKQLKPEFFHDKNRNQELQLAAVQAVVRCRGAQGLEMVWDYQQATHWWEEEAVVDRIKTMLLENKAPGKELLDNAAKLHDLKEWYAKFGAEYVRQLNAPR